MCNQPQRHHFVPIFYLKRWSGTDGRVCEFSVPYKEIKARRVHPAGTGYLNRLYELRGFPPHLSQQVETKFFAPIDSQAAEALDMIEKQGNHAKWTPSTRSAWTRLILAMQLRGPSEIQMLRDSYLKDLYAHDPTIELQYNSIREPSDPETFSEYMMQMDESEKDKSFYEVIFRFMSAPKVGTLINNMIWRVIEIKEAPFPLLTSDRPIVSTRGLGHDYGHIAMPIGPRRLWVAANNYKLIQNLSKVSEKQLVREVNTHVAQQAARYVYGINDQHISFVRKKFGTRSNEGWISRLINNIEKERSEK